MLSRDWVRLLGIRVDNVTWPDLDTYFRSALKSNQPHQVVTVNGEHILAAAKDNRHREVINHADLVVPDSTNVVWASRWQGKPLDRARGKGLAQKTPGVDIVWQLAAIAAETGASIFLLGSHGDIPAQAAQTLQKKYPNLNIAGTSTVDPNDHYVLEHIIQSKADIVLVAYGAPKQEYWIADHKAETGAKILVGVGGTFDILAGKLPRAPEWLRTLQLEWLWRLILQPSRFGRIWNAVVVFPLTVIFAKNH